MKRQRRILISLTVLVAGLLPSTCWAQSGSSETTNHQAAGAFDQGVKFSENKDWTRALEQFERAYAVSPNYRVFYNIAECRHQLKDYAGALIAFERYLSEGDSRVPSARREAVENAMARLRTRVARVRVSSDPAGAEIRVDGAVVGTTPLSAPLVLNAGLRKISAAKPGYAPSSQFLELTERGVSEVAFGLSSSRHRVLLGTKLPSSGGNPSMLPAVAFFSLAAAGLGVGTAFGIDALSTKRKLDRECPNGTCPATSQPLIDDSRRSAVLSTVGFAVGLAGAGAGVAFLFLRPSLSRPVGGPTVQPLIGIGSIGAVGTF